MHMCARQRVPVEGPCLPTTNCPLHAHNFARPCQARPRSPSRACLVGVTRLLHGRGACDDGHGNFKSPPAGVWIPAGDGVRRRRRNLLEARAAIEACATPTPAVRRSPRVGSERAVLRQELNGTLAFGRSLKFAAVVAGRAQSLNSKPPLGLGQFVWTCPTLPVAVSRRASEGAGVGRLVDASSRCGTPRAPPQF